MKLAKTLSFARYDKNTTRQRVNSLPSNGVGRINANSGGRVTSVVRPTTVNSAEAKISRKSEGLNFWLQRVGLLILIFAVAASAANLLSLSSYARVTFLNASQASATSSQSLSTYESVVDAKLRSSIWNRNKLTVNTGGISQQLLKQYPGIASINISVPMFSHRLLVYLTAAKPALVLNAANGSYVVDQTGKVLASASSSTASSLHLPVINDQSGQKATVNHQILPSNDVNFIQIVVAELAARGYIISSFSLPPSSNELDAHITGQGYFVKFNLENNDPQQQAGTFLATMATLKKQNVQPGQYVDVRVDGRAYYQ